MVSFSDSDHLDGKKASDYILDHFKVPKTSNLSSKKMKLLSKSDRRLQHLNELIQKATPSNDVNKRRKEAIEI